MKRTVCSLLAAGVATLALAAPANAHPADPDRPPDSGWRRTDSHFEAYGYRRDARWWALVRARRAFYRHWDGNPWARARFERWYARRCDQLRYWR
jgi:hypothetical protein